MIYQKKNEQKRVVTRHRH